MTARDASKHRNESLGEYGSALARVLAIALVVFGFLPIANWIASGHSAPWYFDVAQSWITGTAIVVGVVIILVVLSRRRVVNFALSAAKWAGGWFDRKPFQATLLIAFAAVVVYGSAAILVFDARALFIDEIVQLYQARLFADGRLTDPVGPFPEFFGALNVVSVADRQFGQFPPGGPAHLLLGVLVGAPWLINPLTGALAVLVFATLARRIEPEPTVALAAVLLFAFSPFMLFMSASHMNHVPTLFWVLVAWLAWSHLTSENGANHAWALLFGIAAGMAATIRPVDAVAMTTPAVTLLLLRSNQNRRAATVALMAAGAMLPGALLLAFNAATTGSPFLFGYEAIWGKAHSLGFHTSPWGEAHTPARGVELLNLYGLRLQSYLFETPTPSLLPVLATLAVVKRITVFDRAMLWAIVLIAVAYFAYWHDGFYLGPRFFFVLTPALALLAARAPRALGEATSREAVRNYVFVGLATSFLIALATAVPQRGRLYARSLSNSRHRLTAPVDTLGVRNGLIFVRESWGSQVLARLWGRRIPPPEAELLYRSIDTCILDAALTQLEDEGAVGAVASTRLWPLVGDSASLEPSRMSPDHTERVGRVPYTERCLQHVMQDRQGTALYPLILAEARGRNVFARDLGSLNSRLLQRYPERVPYLLLPRSLGDSAYLLRPLVR